MIYRHGDILLVPTNKTAGEKVSKGKSYILAYGEKTGHNHKLVADHKDTSFAVYEKNGEITLQLGVAGTLIHEEHKTLEVAPGTYRVVHEREKDHFTEAVRRVID